ncbi:UNVERIFIED_CONTAM: hypothetical protein HDU68_007347 [Siphonaria sp. JEL0065]|nr:hypothetical protein HDU68_007347 [Siphonaria sp. JEL0065]
MADRRKQYDTRIATSCHCGDHCNKFCVIDINRSISKHPYARVDSESHNRGTPKTLRPSSSTPQRPRRIGRFFSDQSGSGVAAISIHPIHTNYLALGCSDDIVRVYDRRIVRPPGTADWTTPDLDVRGEIYSVIPPKFTPAEAQRRVFDPHKITSLKFDPSGVTLDMLVSYSGEKVFLLRPCNGAENFEAVVFESASTLSENNTPSNINDDAEKDDTPPLFNQPEERGKTDVLRSFQGHRNRQTMIKEAYFYGPKSEVIMSGSDDGTVVVWEKSTGKVINKIKADKSVVNCLSPNPLHDSMLAVSGIDHDIKILQPTLETSWLSAKERGVSQQEDEDEEEEEEEDDNVIAIPRHLLLAYLARMGVTIEDLLGADLEED